MQNYRTFCQNCDKHIYMGDIVTCGLGSDCPLTGPHEREEIPLDFDRTTSAAPDNTIEVAAAAFLPEMVNLVSGPDVNPASWLERTKFDWPEVAEVREPVYEMPRVTSYPDDNPKTVLGLSKPSFTAIPPVALVHLGRAMSDGRRKYGLMNWREKTVTTSVYVDAAFRHLLSFWDGEDQAQDSLVEHLGHVMACCAIVLDAASTGKLNDDRPVPGKFSETVTALTKAS